ncbi:caffeic acid 3-O-methyltransferase-like [Pistacia vera]|uniref:caffeic acid 3-O-methyltransferase-like n=1 Tax=Pistacia vera TaxID=55513 RepID=UPI001263A065|nr:caffeic acid 3-O-methyltransferase-like [Pistacia vera]
MGSLDNKQQQSINNTGNEDCLNAFMFSNLIAFPIVLKAAIELNLFAIMAKAGPGAHISASEIVSQLPTNNPSAASMLDRMLRLLASHSMLKCSLRTLEDGRVEKLYALTPSSQLFVSNDDELSLSDVSILSYHPALMEARFRLKDAILEETDGDLFKKVHGLTLFEYMNNDPTFNNIFNSAMVGLSQFVMKGILEVYRGYEGLSSLVDVGGGIGKCLHMITSKYPHIKGINYDLPHVIQSAPSYPGIEHVGGDMFSNVPTADAITLKNILHDWSDENCIKILGNCYTALPSNGKLIILSAVLPEEPESSKYSMYVSRADNLMLMHTPAGKERTEKEHETLCRKAGFSNFQLVCSFQGIHAIIECYK